MGGGAALAGFVKVLGAVATVASSVASASAAKKGAAITAQNAEIEARNLEAQGAIARQESLDEAERKAKEVRKFEARQRMQFLQQGVSVSGGSPLLVFDETLTDGQREVDALIRRGNAQIDLYNAKAQQARNSGAAALIAGNAQATTALLGGVTNIARVGLFSSKGSSSTSTDPYSGTFVNPLFSGSSGINNGPAPLPAYPTRLPFNP